MGRIAETHRSQRSGPLLAPTVRLASFLFHPQRARSLRTPRASDSQARMRAHLVVVDAPVLDDPPCRGQRGEHVLVQALVAKLAVEALHEAVLHRLARLRCSARRSQFSVVHFSIALQVSSVPLSETIIPGLPQCATSRSSTRTIRLPGSDVSISTPSPRRVNWSSTLKTRKRRPVSSVSDTKSSTQIALGAPLSPAAPACRSRACDHRAGALSSLARNTADRPSSGS